MAELVLREFEMLVDGNGYDDEQMSVSSALLCGGRQTISILGFALPKQ